MNLWTRRSVQKRYSFILLPPTPFGNRVCRLAAKRKTSGFDDGNYQKRRDFTSRRENSARRTADDAPATEPWRIKRAWRSLRNAVHEYVPFLFLRRQRGLSEDVNVVVVVVVVREADMSDLSAFCVFRSAALRGGAKSTRGRGTLVGAYGQPLSCCSSLLDRFPRSNLGRRVFGLTGDDRLKSSNVPVGVVACRKPTKRRRISYKMYVWRAVCSMYTGAAWR